MRSMAVLTESLQSVPRMKFDPKAEFSTATGRDRLVRVLMDTALTAGQKLVQTGCEGLPRRYLPPGKHADLYRLYMAECFANKRPLASSSTFFRVLKTSGWKQVLRFRKKSTHAECTTCHQLKSAMRHSKDLRSHAIHCDRYMRHLAGTFADRRTYWELRERSSVQKDLLVGIVDGMDKSKFLLPRYHLQRVPKALETRARPSCDLSAVLLHGWGVFLYVTDSDQSTGTDWTIEILSRSINEAWCIAQRERRDWPSIFRVFADNTPKDACAGYGFMRHL